ncbi:MAG TPA: YhgE/Pip domain-containing protein [Candidatus Blautia stercoravium]|nr:YhgE/Pip domain-containing protein [Candidatus Blautia stercoravium]
MLRREWKKLLSNKMMLVVVLAIIAIPTIYTTLFLGSMWDPYGNVDKLPVAVVNEDQPVTYEGETLDVGKQMVDNLKEDNSLDFHFTDADTAREGLKDGTYYMVITIPDNFSANAATLTDDKPQKMELSYDTNPGTNYIASKMSATAMETIESSIREEVTKTYTEAVFDQISEAGDGMQEAADGSGKLKDGAVELAEGNQTITDNLKTLADSSLTFRDGSKTLTQGLKTYVDGVSTVNSGAKELDSGAASLKDGLDQLNGQLPTLTSGVAALSDGTAQLAQGTETAKQGSAVLKSGTELVDDNLQTLNAGLSTLQAATANLPAQTAQLDEGVGSVQAGTESLQAGLQDLQSGVEQLVQSTDTVSSQLQAGNTQALSQIRAGAQNMKDKVDAFLGAMGNGQTTGAVQTLDVSGIQNELNQIAGGKDSADTSAAAAAQAAADTGAAGTADVSYLYDSLNQAVEAQDMDAVAAIANEAIAAAQNNKEAADDASNRLAAAGEALNNSSAALTQAGQALGRAADVSEAVGGMSAPTAETGTAGIGALQSQLQEMSAGLQQIIDGTNTAAAQLNAGVSYGLGQLKAGVTQQIQPGIAKLTEGARSLNQGVSAVKAGTSDLAASSGELTEGIQSAAAGGQQLKTQGTEALKSGAAALDDGLSALQTGSQDLDNGVQTLAGSVPTLTGGVGQLADGSSQLKDGTVSLVQGTGQLTANNSTLLSGSSQLGEGAKQISDGANLLYEGSQTLGNGIKQVEDGSQTLKDSLADGAETVKDTKMGEDTVDMFAAPVDIHETQITTVENNGHAMAPYMMSVALWVGCIAFSLMYPLTKYSGKLTSGTAWWASKASVLYLIAILQAIVMVFMLHVCDGFEPVEMGKTLAVACVTSLAFMSVMYFFTNTFGKVGSFLMLVFMVIQLAGSVGTYPLELSGSFVPYLHDWVPFTYTVEAFRSTISGGESIQGAIVFLAVIFVVFTALTILEFQIRTKKIRAKKHTLDEWLETKGLA